MDDKFIEKTIDKLIDHTIEPISKEVSKFSTDIIKTIRLVTAPI